MQPYLVAAGSRIQSKEWIQSENLIGDPSASEAGLLVD